MNALVPCIYHVINERSHIVIKIVERRLFGPWNDTSKVHVFRFISVLKWKVEAGMEMIPEDVLGPCRLIPSGLKKLT